MKVNLSMKHSPQKAPVMVMGRKTEALLTCQFVYSENLPGVMEKLRHINVARGLCVHCCQPESESEMWVGLYVTQYCGSYWLAHGHRESRCGLEPLFH